MASREETLFAIRLALRAVPRGSWRDLARPGVLPRDSNLAGSLAAGAILEHLGRAGWRLEHRPPTREGPGLHSKIR